MIGDKIVIEKIHELKADIIFGYLVKWGIQDKVTSMIDDFTSDNKIILSIGGESGTGKSEIAILLREMFFKSGITSYIISQDDYYSSDYQSRNKLREKNGIETVGYQEIEVEKLNTLCSNFKENKGLQIQQLNLFTRLMEIVIASSVFNVLILEGLYTNYLNADFKVYLEGNVRDTQYFRMNQGKEEQTDFRQKVLEKESRVVCQSKPLANLIITFDGDLKIRRFENK